MATDFTIFCAADEPHLEQLRIVLPTWRENCPELFSRPAVLMCDIRERGIRWWIRENPAPEWFNVVPNTTKQRVGDSQRAYMLHGFMAAMPAVRTPWALKIDTDALCLQRCPNWIPTEYLKSDAAIIAPRWGYTTPASFIDQLNDWAYRIPALNQSDPVTGEREQARGKERIRHPRICSWFGFFSHALCKITMELIGDGPFPCPSQDTTHWYVAHCLGLPVVKWKPRGWRVCSSTRTLRRFATEVLQDAPV